MLTINRSRLFTVLALAALGGSSFAAGPAFTDPKEAGEDFELQGEYSGELETPGGKEKFGLHVIALGEGKFRAVGYHGGLPGDGYNGEDPVIVPGEFTKEDGAVTFMDKHGSGVLKGGKIVCTLKSLDRVAGALERVVRKSPTLGQKPPEGAVVLFNGEGADHWQNGKTTDDGLLMPGTTSKQKFGSHKLHIEFRLPFQPQEGGQARGNSGVYLQGRYEVQMLDSFGLEGKQNECGGLYSVKDPDLNMCYPPLSWQTYDIDYTAAKFDDAGKVASPPRVTVRHNGVVIHDDVELPADRNTTAAPVQPGPEPGPVYVQDHGNPVRYRNIWVVETEQ